MRLQNHYRANLPKSSIFYSLSALSIRLCWTKIARSFLLTALTLLAALVFSSSHALAQSPPGSVSSVSLSRADGTVTATWPAVAGATSYHVTYSSDGGGSWSLAALNHPNNSITIGVDNAKTYIVGVRARNEHGDSGWTNSPAAGPYTPGAAQDAGHANVGNGDAVRRHAHRVLACRRGRDELPRHLQFRRGRKLEPGRAEPSEQQHRHRRGQTPRPI